MPTILEILFHYYCEKVQPPKFINYEEEERAYKLLETSFSKTQKELFNEWEELSTFKHCEEIRFWFEYGFKKGMEFVFGK